MLAWDAVEPVLDENGEPVTHWDGRTTKPHPVTGEEVPDETTRTPEFWYVNPRKAEWPEAEFIVGNPPFIGTARMRDALGHGYTEAIRRTYSQLPKSVDYVMYWWHVAAERVKSEAVARFGFITTNSLRQTFNQRVIRPFLIGPDRLSIVFAIPDHPWIDSSDGADVRICMTVAVRGILDGLLQTVKDEKSRGELGSIVALGTRSGEITEALRVGATVSRAVDLSANARISSRGMQLIGKGFIVTRDRAAELGLGRLNESQKHIREYRNGRDLNATPRGVLVIDVFGLSEEEIRERFPEIYQHLLENMRPERRQNRRQSYRDNWLYFGEPRSDLRLALRSLPRFLATVETSKHRMFVFLNAEILPDNKLVSFALSDAFSLGVLSSRVHTTWASAAGSRLGIGNDLVYVKSKCFETFPFPDPDDSTKARIRELGEQLDSHR